MSEEADINAGASRSGFLSRIGSEAIVTAVIAVLAVGAATVSFQTHVEDFEAATKEELAELKARVGKIEDREREASPAIARVEGQLERVHQDLTALKRQMERIIERLPPRQ